MLMLRLPVPNLTMRPAVMSPLNCVVVLLAVYHVASPVPVAPKRRWASMPILPMVMRPPLTMVTVLN